ncbi:MAG TPA: hypothetical protein VFE62_29415 [Gemmataceae bacterium]|nr:hypothetical protein [Gemmataceae bacterium]
MRRKLYFGVTLALAIGLIAGGFLLNQIGAQDAPKTEKKGTDDLFEILKKKLEAKSNATDKDKPLPLPAVQAPTPLPTPPGEGSGLAPLSVGDLPKPGPLPSDTKPADLPLPTQKPGIIPPNQTPLPAPPESPKPAVETQNSLPLPPVSNKQAEPEQRIAPPAGNLPMKNLPMSKQIGIAPPPGNLVPQNVPVVDPTPIKPAIATEPIKLKGSAWSLYVEVVDGRTVVTATVNKKHEFKIVCQSLDLQTVAGCMKARGKVTITGDCLNGSCDQLILPLHDDRLVLEGMADVRIQKVSGNVSESRPSAFELKGDKLDLRISDLQSSTYLETNWRKVKGEDSDVRPMRAVSRGTSSEAAKSWTPYGTLRSSGNGWSLQAASGEIIAYVLARDGGSLDQYIGRTIAVFGAREGEREGRPLVRVTHIAVP